MRVHPLLEGLEYLLLLLDDELRLGLLFLAHLSFDLECLELGPKFLHIGLVFGSGGEGLFEVVYGIDEGVEVVLLGLDGGLELFLVGELRLVEFVDVLHVALGFGLDDVVLPDAVGQCLLELRVLGDFVLVLQLLLFLDLDELLELVLEQLLVVGGVRGVGGVAFRFLGWTQIEHIWNRRRWNWSYIRDPSWKR